MSTYRVDLGLRQGELSDAECEALYEAGCDDATIGICEGVTRITFDRMVASLEAAFESAARDGRNAGFEVAGVEMDVPDAVLNVR